MTTYLLAAAAVIFVCVLLNKVTSHLGIPVLLAFILLGMFFGSDGVVKIPFDDHALAEQICSVALIFIMFYGGFGTSWKEAKPVAGKAILLSSLGVVLTAGLVGVFCRLALGMGWLESFLLGSVIGSTDAASVFSILRSRHLNLKDHTASMLEVESGSNDPFAYMLTALFLAMMKGQATGGGVAMMMLLQLAVGIGFGAVLSVAAIWLMKRARFSPGFDAACVMAIALLSYAAPAALGGNGYLSAYIVGIALGNADIRHKRTLVPFFDGLTSLMQMLIFFLLGLLSFPSKLLQVALPSLLVALFLTFVGRPLAVGALLTPFRCGVRQQAVVAWAGLRGAASIVFAVMAVRAVDPGYDLLHMVLCIVLFSILLQGSLLPLLSRKLCMIDESGDVMKTFSDYTEQMPVRFIELNVPAEHPWCGQAVRSLTLPPDTILALCLRGEEKLVPNGSTVLLPGDRLILCAKSPGEIEGVNLTEQTITRGSDAVGHTLAQCPPEGGALAILILRKGSIVIPGGDTLLMEGDVLVLNQA